MALLSKLSSWSALEALGGGCLAFRFPIQILLLRTFCLVDTTLPPFLAFSSSAKRLVSMLVVTQLKRTT